MAKWKIFLTVLCSFVAGALILLAVLVYVPRTTELDYDMRGYIISTDGQIMEEFTMTATGKEYDFIIDRPNGQVHFVGNAPERVERDTFYLDIRWDSSTISKNAASGLFSEDFRIPNTQYILGYLYVYSSATDSLEREYGIFEPNDGVFYLYADGLIENAFVVGITDPNADPLAVLKTYQSVEGLLHRPELLPPAEN